MRTYILWKALRLVLTVTATTTKQQKVITMTTKYPLSLHFQAILCTATGLRLTLNCSASKGLQFCKNRISSVIAIEEMV